MINLKEIYNAYLQNEDTDFFDQKYVEIEHLDMLQIKKFIDQMFVRDNFKNPDYCMTREIKTNEVNEYVVEYLLKYQDTVFKIYSQSFVELKDLFNRYENDNDYELTYYFYNMSK